MFLDRVAQLKLLEHDPESNILKNFPEGVRIVICSEVVSFLLSPAAAVNVIVSRSHALWAMEVCGEGYRLPIDECEEVIQNVTELYRQWIFDPKKRPSPIGNEFQFFLQRMVKHFSLLFSMRSEAVVDAHSRLCSSVLNIFQQIPTISKKKIGEVSEETWEVILKLLVAMGDSLFLAPRGPSSLGDRLCKQMLRVLFECWLEAQTFKPEMWGYLKDRVSKWTHISQTIAQWQSVSVALTSRLVRHMYGPQHGAESVIIRLDKEQNVMKLAPDYILYAWHRILNLLDDLNAIPIPANFLAAYQGVDSLVIEFLKVRENLPPKVRPPDGNTILHIFGKWLFEAIQLNKKGFEEGTALAIKIVSGIFLETKGTVFLNTYLASYYRCLQEVLLSDGKPLVSAIVSSQKLLGQAGLSGARILVQHYISAITRIISGNVTIDPPYKARNVRLCSLEIFSQIMCYPKFFSKASLKLKLSSKEKQGLSQQSSSNQKISEAKTYNDLRQHMSSVLVEALKHETTTSNLLMILQLCFSFSVMYIDEDQDFARNTISVIVGKCVSPKIWDQVVVYEGLVIVSRMVFLLPKFVRGKELAGKIVNPLCGYVSQLCSELYRVREEGDKQLRRLTVQAFHTIAAWVQEDQWLVHSPDRLKNVLDAASLGICGPKVKEETVVEKKEKGGKKDRKDKKGGAGMEVGVVEVKGSKKIGAAARLLMRCLLNRLGAFPALCGPSSVSTLITEAELINQIVEKAEQKGHKLDKKQLLRSFILQDQTLVTVIDHPYEDDGPKATVILRDATGRYCWRCSQAYLPFDKRGIENQTMVHCQVPVKIADAPYHSSAKPLEEGRLEDIYNYLETRKTDHDPFQLASEMDTREKGVLEEVNYQISKDMTIHPPSFADAYTSNCKFQQGRLLMTHLGFLALENWGKVQQLEQSAGYFSLIKSLDEIPERQCLSVSVVYRKSGQNWNEVLSNTTTSLAYQEFLSSLGWGIHIPTHTGYLGGLERNPSQHGEFSVYYSNSSCELVYHAANLMPNIGNKEEQNHKIRLIGGNKVAIVWHEDINEEYVPDYGRSNLLHIVISPIFMGCISNLYRIQLHLKKEIATKFWGVEKTSAVFGPAMNGMILSKEKLGVLVRETAISASITIKDAIDNLKKKELPFEQRERMILEIAKKYPVRDDATFDGWNTSLLSANPSKNVEAPLTPFLSRAARQQFLDTLAKYSKSRPPPARTPPTLPSLSSLPISPAPGSSVPPPLNLAAATLSSSSLSPKKLSTPQASASPSAAFLPPPPPAIAHSSAPLSHGSSFPGPSSSPLPPSLSPRSGASIPRPGVSSGGLTLVPPRSPMQPPPPSRGGGGPPAIPPLQKVEGGITEDESSSNIRVKPKRKKHKEEDEDGDSDGEHKKSRRRERKGRTRADVVTESGGDGGEGGEGAASSGGWSLHIGEKRGLSGSGSHSKQEGGKIAIGNRTVETEEDGE